ncbi:hypothetical protein HMPREF9094_2552, partial [Fusobacterium animalis ATCC 51191]
KMLFLYMLALLFHYKGSLVLFFGSRLYNNKIFLLKLNCSK